MKKTLNDQNLEYIRWKYQVPAYRGVKVKTWNNRQGTIAGAESGNIKIEFETAPKVEYHHPTDVVYQIVIGDRVAYELIDEEMM